MTVETQFMITENRTASGRERYDVTSPSGTTYQVTYCGSGDWECNCPAGRHGRDCKHVAMVNAYRQAQAVATARLCLPIFEKQYPGDDRPRKAIEAVESHISGLEWRYTLSEACKIMRCSRRQFYRYRERGLRIEQERPGTKVLVRASEIERFMRERIEAT